MMIEPIPAQTNNPLPPAPVPKSIFKKPIFLVILGLVLLVAVAFSLYYISKKSTEPLIQDNPQAVINPLPDNYKYTVMENNKYPSGFPQTLMVKGGVWQRGEDTVTADGTKLKIVEMLYSSTTPIATLAASFQTNFEKAGWKTTDDKIQTDLAVKTFTKKTDTVTLTIVPVGDKILANLTLKTQ